MAIGALGVNQIAGKWSARQIFGQVWTAAVEKSILMDPRIIPTMPMNRLRATIPIMGNGLVQSQLDEFEHSVAANAAPAGKDITLYKDRVKLMVSDEATMESDVGDPMMLQKNQASSELAGNLEKLIATSLATTPQTYTTADWDTVSPLLTISQMIETLRPYQASAVVMDSAIYPKYVSALGKLMFSGGNTDDVKRGVYTLPGYGLPVFVSDVWGDASANTVAVIANDVPGAVLGTGAVKSRSWDDEDLGAMVYQTDVWRTPVSNLRQTSGSLNRGVITCVIT